MNSRPMEVTVETGETGREERKLLFSHSQMRVQSELVGEVREELKAKAGGEGPRRSPADGVGLGLLQSWHSA